MSHIVIHDDAKGVTQYQQFGELEKAIALVERLRNDEGVDNARLYELDEVVFEMKPYFKVEIGGVCSPEVAVETVGPPEILPTAFETDMVFETASAPIEAVATVSSSDDLADGDVGDDGVADGGGADGGVADGGVADGGGADESLLAKTGGEARRGLFGR